MNRRRLLKALSLGIASTKLPIGSTLFAETQAGAGSAPRTGAASEKKPGLPPGANDRLNIGVIGPGSRGQELIRQFLKIPSVNIAQVCDVYPLRFKQVDELVGRSVPHVEDYRALIDNKDIDIIVVATPPVFHASYSIATMESGRPVYCEKTTGFTPAENRSVVDAVQRTGQVYQVGHQNRYSSHFREAIERIHKGEIGQPTHLYGYYFRTDNWRRTVPNPKLEHLLNWRLYQESSGGLLEELGSHQIDVCNWMFKVDQPLAVMGTVSIVKWHDGRTVGDNVQAILDYPEGHRMVFSSTMNNAFPGDSYWIYGDNGTVQITYQDATFYGRHRKTMTAKSHDLAVNPKLKVGATYQTATEMPYRGPGDRIHMKPGEIPTLEACKSFIDCVRNKKQPFAGITAGYGSGIACAVGKTAVREARQMPLPPLHNL